jgi:Carboxypeptidase regulatory-like domain
MTAQSPKSNRKTLIAALVGGTLFLIALFATAWVLIKYLGNDNKTVVIDVAQKPAEVQIPANGAPPTVANPAEPPTANENSIGGVVKNDQGAPVNRATVQVRYMENGAQAAPIRARTDGMGRWIASIPKDATRVRIFASQRDYASTNSTLPMAELLARTAVVVLNHGVDIAGQVVDENGNPLAGVKVQQGTTATARSVTTDGQGRFTLTHLRQGQIQLTFTSDQYGVVSQTVMAQLGMAPLKIAMKPPMTLKAFDPDGTPAAGAAWGTATVGQYLTVMNGEQIFGNNGVGPQRKAGADGKILVPGADSFMLVMVDPKGWVEMDSTDIPSSHEVHLTGWGRITGVLMLGRKPLAKGSAGVYHPQQYDNTRPFINFGANATADDKGQFVIDRVVPGEAVVYELKNKTIGGQTIGMAGQMQPVTVTAGQTTVVQIGGKGRPVVGTVEIPPELAARKDWYFSYGCRVQEMQDAKALVRDALASLLHKQDSTTPSIPRQYSIDIHPDGTYRIDDVEAGQYQMYIQAGTGPYGQQQIAYCSSMFTVPPMPGGRSDEPLQLPPVKLNVTRR